MDEVDMYVVQAQDLVQAEIDTIGAQFLTLLSVERGTITVQCALLRLESFGDEMTTEAAGTGVQIGTSVVDQGLRMIEVGDIEAGVQGQGTWMMKQTCQYLEEIQGTCQMFN